MVADDGVTHFAGEGKKMVRPGTPFHWVNLHGVRLGAHCTLTRVLWNHLAWPGGVFPRMALHSSKRCGRAIARSAR